MLPFFLLVLHALKDISKMSVVILYVNLVQSNQFSNNIWTKRNIYQQLAILEVISMYYKNYSDTYTLKAHYIIIEITQIWKLLGYCVVLVVQFHHFFRPLG